MFLGRSQAILRVLELIGKAARSTSTVLLVGETGVGKDVVANEIHNRSGRAGRLLPVNCSAIPRDLIESELFGHERGAFTSASVRRLGIFEQANGGTVFLDEITEMTLDLQPKLLRVLEDHSIRRVGGDENIPVNVRVIAATNRPLDEALRERELREDLYYRLNVFKILIPPLRERLEDLDLLVAYFIEEVNREQGKEVEGLDSESFEALRVCTWPGNVRQLRNAIEQAVVTCEHGRITVRDLPGEIYKSRHKPASITFQVGIAMREAERQFAAITLEANDGNRARTARVLDVSRHRLYELLPVNGVPRGRNKPRP